MEKSFLESGTAVNEKGIHDSWKNTIINAPRKQKK